jgi:hypothetical protein
VRRCHRSEQKNCHHRGNERYLDRAHMGTPLSRWTLPRGASLTQGRTFQAPMLEADRCRTRSRGTYRPRSGRGDLPSDPRACLATRRRTVDRIRRM